MSEFKADVTVVGSGIAGLWSAKELIDQGLTVNIVEKSDTLADGATTRNEGWLHAGTYHSVAIEDGDEGASVVSSIITSHEEIVDFAPESIDHTATFALTLSTESAERAIDRWEQMGVAFTITPKEQLADLSVLDAGRIETAFRVNDKSINSLILCQKLARYILQHGGRIFAGADFIPESDTTARIIQEGDQHHLVSEIFLITAGAGIKDVVEQITGNPLPMRFFKAHLLVMPRITRDNYFHLEPGEAGLMNHGPTSTAGINRDGIQLLSPDRKIVFEKTRLIYRALTRMFLPTAQTQLDYSQLMPVACCKPDMTDDFGATQSLDVNVFQPAPNYLCALPGKMTMAPYLAKQVADILLTGNVGIVSPLPFNITPRPTDVWMSRQAS